MNLPISFITTIINTYRADGKHWLAELPARIDEASHRWGLVDIQPVENPSYNFVAFAEQHPSGAERSREVVLKIGVPNRELISEINALRLYAGQGAVRLLEADEPRGMFLLERLQPGRMLSTLEDDEQATFIAAQIMAQIRRPVPASHTFIYLRDWFDGLKELRVRYNGGTGPLASHVVEMAEHILPDLFAEPYEPAVIHGDLHHFNILSSERGWLVIDPKGVVGPREYEVGPLLINPWGGLAPTPRHPAHYRTAHCYPFGGARLRPPTNSCLGHRPRCPFRLVGCRRKWSGRRIQYCLCRDFQ